MVNVIETEKGLQTESGLIIPKGCYQWGKGVFTTSYEAICAIIKENSNNVLYYNNVESWRLEVILPLRYQQQKAFIESFFFPLLDKEDTLLEIGCAEGEWTFLISPYVKAIQAYDFSHRLIQNARHKLADSDITNITFMEGDICTMEIQDTYRVISFMGVLSCIIDWEQTKLIVKKLYKALAGGGI